MTAGIGPAVGHGNARVRPRGGGRPATRRGRSWGRAACSTRLGVDGLIVAEIYPVEVRPAGSGEWELVHADAEGRVYHRRGSPLSPTSARCREPRPVRRPCVIVENGRQRIAADVDVTAAAPVTIAFRRPFFPGWRATLDNGRVLPVSASPDRLSSRRWTCPPEPGRRLTLRLPAAGRGVLGAALALAAVAVAGGSRRGGGGDGIEEDFWSVRTPGGPGSCFRGGVRLAFFPPRMNGLKSSQGSLRQQRSGCVLRPPPNPPAKSFSAGFSAVPDVCARAGRSGFTPRRPRASPTGTSPCRSPTPADQRHGPAAGEAQERPPARGRRPRLPPLASGAGGVGLQRGVRPRRGRRPGQAL